MKKTIIAVAVILVILSSMLVSAGLKLNILSNSLAEAETAIQELKRMAEPDSAKYAKVHTRTFEEEMAFVEGMTEAMGEVIGLKDFLRRKDVEYHDDDYSAITAFSYKNGMPKIVIPFYYDSKRSAYVRNPIAITHFFLAEDGTKIAFSFDGGIHWTCSDNSKNTHYFIFTDPNTCRNLYRNKPN